MSLYKQGEGIYGAATILIVDFGSQYTLLIARALRECGYRSVVLSPAKASVWAASHTPRSFFFWGDKSIHDEGAPVPPENILVLDVPTLGICYGMQWLADHLGGRVDHSAGDVEYGPASVALTNHDDLFRGIDPDQAIWASHGDSVTSLPEGVDVIATSSNDADSIRAMRLLDKKFWGVQFHPEVPQTMCGKKILTNFVHGICGLSLTGSQLTLSPICSRRLGRIHRYGRFWGLVVV